MSKVWLVTGSSRGLGRNIVEVALEAGEMVVATARKPEQLQDLVERYGDQVRTIALDVTNPESATNAVKAAVEAFGRIDVLVNNAGYGDIASVEDVTIDDFKAQIDTNFYGVVYMTKAVLPVMRQQGSGHIIQVSSIGGRSGAPGLAGYQSAKWAVGGFSTVLTQEVAPFGIKVTVLEPGGMRTDWAGTSMTIPPISKPYEQTVGAFVGFLKTIAGNEVSDPVKVAKVIVELIDMPEPPFRLLIGTDAVFVADSCAKNLADSDAKWRSLSESVGFESNPK
ncbi:SDR family NAD(P)-dependent oxidoreductase [Geobacter sp. AOG1]|uniref:SDR family NAD(P)-dependent oxidoreductase n=1 Tax=Geobacter sp. AOG1 TaxID=1566346 RepID=UPI001CC48774|nr:SDR family NAD(P)-dependent oxidoreductase [Geobacter sp. AOG1]GFE58513.1 short-chain dehydrogenase/reductase [Geobacter sp. AOG1]